MSAPALVFGELAQPESESSHDSVEQWLFRNAQSFTISTPSRRNDLEAIIDPVILNGHADAEEISYFDWDSSDEEDDREDEEEDEDEVECESVQIFECDDSCQVAENEENWNRSDDKTCSSSQSHHEWLMIMYQETRCSRNWVEELERDLDQRSDGVEMCQETLDVADHSNKRHVHGVDNIAFDASFSNAQYCATCILPLLHSTGSRSFPVSAWAHQKHYFARISHAAKEAFRRYSRYRLIRRVER